MATVVTIPKDTRLADQTKSIGAFLDQQGERRREAEEKERRRGAFQQALQGLNNAASADQEPTAQELTNIGTSLDNAGVGDQIPKFVNMLANLRQEKAKQGVIKTSQEAAQRVGQGDVEGAFSTPGINLSQQGQIANAQAALRQNESEKSKVNLSVFEIGTGREQVLRVDPTLGGSELDAVVPEGFERKKPLNFGDKDRTQTQTERDDISQLRNAGMEVNQKNKDLAAGLRLGRTPVNKALITAFNGTFTEGLSGQVAEMRFGRKAEQQKYFMAAGLINDVLLSGVDRADAPAIIRKQVEKDFTTGSFIPQRIRDGGPTLLKEFLDQRGIDAPEILQFYSDLALVSTDAEAFRRVAEVLNPALSLKEIDAKVKERFPNG